MSNSFFDLPFDNKPQQPAKTDGRPVPPQHADGTMLSKDRIQSGFQGAYTGPHSNPVSNKPYSSGGHAAPGHYQITDPAHPATSFMQPGYKPRTILERQMYNQMFAGQGRRALSYQRQMFGRGPRRP